MSLYILAEHNNRSLDMSIRQVLSAAVLLDPHPIVIVIGHECADVAAEAAALPGVATVMLIDNPIFEQPLAEYIAPMVAGLVTECTHLLMASTTCGKNILPRIAALLDVAQVSDVTRIVHSDTFEHPIYAGNALETVQMLDKTKVVSIRTAAFSALTGNQAPCAIQTKQVDIPTISTRFVRRELSQSLRPELANAKIIVSGGRGLQSAEQFKLVEALADALGAALGASRAAVDAGFISNDHQVGQTGKIVAPHLYIAVGISGAIQHIAGIKDAQVIVAINKDESAPIFQVANYGLVGDLFELIPQIIQELKQRGLHKC